MDITKQILLQPRRPMWWSSLMSYRNKINRILTRYMVVFIIQ